MALTDTDREHIQKSEVAIKDGLALRDWCLNGHGGLKLFPLDLKKQFKLKNTAQGYLGHLDINGKNYDVMGVVQDAEFAHLDGPDAQDVLKEFVFKEFLHRANWKNEDGFPGGFGLQRTLYQTCAGEYGKFPENEAVGSIDWRDLGEPKSTQKYRWVLQIVRIYDFVMQFGPVLKRFAEAAAVVLTPEFMKVIEKPRAGVQLEVQVGYPFAEITPIPNFFGFGPGKFGVAVKLYSFDLMDDGAVRVRMDFAAAPRCKKVFDFGKAIPDPVYGGAALLSKLTFGLYKAERAHTHMDSVMLAQHSRVHQSLIDGTVNVWNEWRKGAFAQAADADVSKASVKE